MVKTMQPLLIEDAKSDFRFDVEEAVFEEPRAIRSLMSVPLVVGNKILGILRADCPHQNYFTIYDTLCRISKT